MFFINEKEIIMKWQAIYVALAVGSFFWAITLLTLKEVFKKKANNTDET